MKVLLYIIAAVFILAWTIGLIGGNMGGEVHIFLALGVIVLIYNFKTYGK